MAERDSYKDEAVVVVFILATSGLLGWALVKPWVQKVRDGGIAGIGIGTGSSEGRNYIPISRPRAAGAANVNPAVGRAGSASRRGGENDSTGDIGVPGTL